MGFEHVMGKLGNFNTNQKNIEETIARAWLVQQVVRGGSIEYQGVMDNAGKIHDRMTARCMAQSGLIPDSHKELIRQMLTPSSLKDAVDQDEVDAMTGALGLDQVWGDSRMHPLRKLHAIANLCEAQGCAARYGLDWQDSYQPQLGDNGEGHVAGNALFGFTGPLPNAKYAAAALNVDEKSSVEQQIWNAASRHNDFTHHVPVSVGNVPLLTRGLGAKTEWDLSRPEAVVTSTGVTLGAREDHHRRYEWKVGHLGQAVLDRVTRPGFAAWDQMPANTSVLRLVGLTSYKSFQVAGERLGSSQLFCDTRAHLLIEDVHRDVRLHGSKFATYNDLAFRPHAVLKYAPGWERPPKRSFLHPCLALLYVTAVFEVCNTEHAANQNVRRLEGSGYRMLPIHFCVVRFHKPHGTVELENLCMVSFRDPKPQTVG